MSILDLLDHAIDGLCPCGADPRPDSAYCSDDCVPNYHGTHTSSDTDGTQMRWRPDLVTAVDDSDLQLIEQRRRGSRTASAYWRRGGTLMHLRLDDGHRYVGCDVDTSTLHGYDGTPLWDHPKWEALERELGPDPAYRFDGSADPWGDLRREAANMAGGATVHIRPINRPGGWQSIGTVVDEGPLVEAAADHIHLHFALSPAQVAATVRSLGLGFARVQESVRTLGNVSEPLVEQMRRFAESVNAEQPEPEHPLARIQARRTNTVHGPQRPQRPPRQIGR